jgi:hypothetical protein
MFLIREIFTRDATKWWFRAIVITTLAQAFAGSLLISVECPPSRILHGKLNDQCAGNVCLRLSPNLTDNDLVPPLPAA